MSKDTMTAFIKKAADILFVMNPRGTSIGVVFGIVLHGFTKALEPVLKKQQLVDLGKVNEIYFILLGIFVFNLRAALRRHSLDPQIESALDAIKKAKRDGQISATQARLMYLNLYEKVLAQIVLDEKTKTKIDRTRRAVNDTDAFNR